MNSSVFPVNGYYLFLYMHGEVLELLGQFSQDLEWKNRIADRRGAFFSAKRSIIDVKQLRGIRTIFHKQLESRDLTL